VDWFWEPSDHHESMITVTPAWEGHLKVFERGVVRGEGKVHKGAAVGEGDGVSGVGDEVESLLGHPLVEGWGVAAGSWGGEVGVEVPQDEVRDVVGLGQGCQLSCGGGGIHRGDGNDVHRRD